MVVSFIDTTILVDILRQYAPALAWLRSQPSLSITPIAWMELIAGARNKTAQLQAAKLLLQFQMIYPTQADIDWAMLQLPIYRLSHGIGILDCLIASGSHRLQAPLYTHNIKHFGLLLGPMAQKPY